MIAGPRASLTSVHRVALLGLVLFLALAAGAVATPPDKPKASPSPSDGDHPAGDQPAEDAAAEVVPELPDEGASSPPGAAAAEVVPALPGEGASAPPGAAAASGSEYLVRPGDTLRISVWREPEMSGDATVRPDGKVTVPLLGDVNAWLRTPQQLSGTIAEGLARFVEEPQVTVAILQANSARFFIIGQVVKPGVYPLAGQISVLQAIALSGGFTPFAKRNRLRLFRGVDGSDGVTQIDFEKLSAGDIRQNFVLQPGDTLVVP